MAWYWSISTISLKKLCQECGFMLTTQCCTTQNSLRQLHDQKRKCDMYFNPAKCEVFRFTRKKTLEAPPNRYVLHDETIASVKTIKYLSPYILRWLYVWEGGHHSRLYHEDPWPEIHRSLRKGLLTAAATCAWVCLGPTTSDEWKQAEGHPMLCSQGTVPKISHIAITGERYVNEYDSNRPCTTTKSIQICPHTSSARCHYQQYEYSVT